MALPARRSKSRRRGLTTTLTLQQLPKRSEFASRAEWEAAYDAFYDSRSADTFGTNLRALTKAVTIPDGLKELLAAARKGRDFLAHRFFRDHDEAMLTTAGKQSMLVACEEQIRILEEADDALEAFLIPYQKAHGITEEGLARSMEEFMAEVRKRTEDPSI